MKMTTKQKFNGRISVVLVTLAVVLTSAQTWAAIIATDDVEDVTQYTNASNASTNDRSVALGNNQGLLPQAGSSYVSVTSDATNPRSGKITYIPGFGGGTLVEAGKYTLTVSAGEGALDRIAFGTFNPFLQTTIDEMVLPGGVETTSWVAPTAPATVAAWQEIVVEFTVPAGDTLIGQEFTWGFDFDKPDEAPFSTERFYSGFDAVSVDFVVSTGGIAGDFDGDDDVDGADFLVWQRDTGANSLSDWETNFGTTAGLSAVTSVPEPTTLLMASAFAVALASSRRKFTASK